MRYFVPVIVSSVVAALSACNTAASSSTKSLGNETVNQNSSHYSCEDAADNSMTEILVSSSGAVTFSDKAALVEETSPQAKALASAKPGCRLPGQGGQVYVGSKGSATWYYRVADVDPGSSQFNLPFVFDFDGQGHNCQADVLSCILE